MSVSPRCTDYLSQQNDEETDFSARQEKEPDGKSVDSVEIIFAKDAEHQDDKDNEKEPQTTNIGIMMHIFKGNVGTGLLSLPLAMYHGGYIFGPIMLVFVATLSIHCMQLLVKVAQHMCKKQGVQSLDYGEVVYGLFAEYGPCCFKKYPGAGSKIVNFFILFTQFGFCCAYVVFIAENVQLLAFQYSTPGTGFNDFVSDTIGAQRVIMLILIIPLCLLVSIRDLKYLAPFSAIANVATLVAVGIIFSYLGENVNNPTDGPMPDGEPYPKVGSLSQFALFFGTVVFSFEGIAIVLPLENSAKDKKAFPKILYGGMIGVAGLYVAFSLMGFFTFGSYICDSITLNLPKQPLYATVSGLYTFSILISYALQFYVPVSFILPAIKATCLKNQGKNCLFWTEMGLRYVLVIGTVILAIVIPDLGDIISLIGAFASSVLALILPPLAEEILRQNTIAKDERDWKYYLGSIKNYFIVSFGVFGMVIGTIVSLDTLINDISGNGSSTTCVAANETSFSVGF